MANKYTHYEVPDIENRQQLRDQISLLKLRITTHELDMGRRVKQLPVEVLKVGINAAVPAFLGNKLAGSTFRIVKGLFSTLFSKSEERGETWKDKVMKPVKQAGIFSALKLAFNLLAKRK
jgi:hypothetical protein